MTSAPESVPVPEKERGSRGAEEQRGRGNDGDGKSEIGNPKSEIKVVSVAP